MARQEDEVFYTPPAIAEYLTQRFSIVVSQLLNLNVNELCTDVYDLGAGENQFFNTKLFRRPIWRAEFKKGKSRKKERRFAFDLVARHSRPPVPKIDRYKISRHSIPKMKTKSCIIGNPPFKKALEWMRGAINPYKKKRKIDIARSNPIAAVGWIVGNNKFTDNLKLFMQEHNYVLVDWLPFSTVFRLLNGNKSNTILVQWMMWVRKKFLPQNIDSPNVQLNIQLNTGNILRNIDQMKNNSVRHKYLLRVGAEKLLRLEDTLNKIIPKSIPKSDSEADVWEEKLLNDADVWEEKLPNDADVWEKELPNLSRKLSHLKVAGSKKRRKYSSTRTKRK